MIVYAAIADKDGIIVETDYSYLSDVFQKLLKHVDPNIDQKRTFSGTKETNGRTLNVVVEEEIYYVCAASDGYQRRICFAFLEYLRAEWVRGRHSRDDCQSFSPILSNEMEHYSHPEQVDKLAQKQAQANEVLELVQEDIQALYAKSARIETANVNAEVFEEKAKLLEKATERARCALCRENIKMTICVGVTAIVCFLCFVGVCGGVGVGVYYGVKG